jgi:septum formation protein
MTGDVLVLASSSPRRRELLQQLGVSFTVEEPTPDDVPADHRPAVAFARDLAAGKAASVAERPAHAAAWVLGADTVVFDESEILLKPTDRTDARRMLERLSGKTHRVVSALALYTPGPAAAAPGAGAGANAGTREPRVEADVTAVTFAPLGRAEVEWYLDTGEWRGVAGGYRIQERGAVLVERIEGSYSAVMGLPIRLLYSMLRDTGFRFPGHR